MFQRQGTIFFIENQLFGWCIDKALFTSVLFHVYAKKRRRGMTFNEYIPISKYLVIIFQFAKTVLCNFESIEAPSCQLSMFR